MKKQKKVISTAILLLVSLLLTSCGGTQEPVASKKPGKIPVYKALENPDEDGFHFSIFADPIQVTEENYQRMKECGIRTVVIDEWSGTGTLESKRKALELCEKLGLDAYLLVNNTHDETTEQLRSYQEAFQEDYTKYPAFKGVYAFDEPWEDQFDWIAEDMKTWQNSQYKDYTYLVNMMAYGEGGNTTTESYLNEYWEKVLSKNDDNILMLDYYPLANTKEGKYMSRVATNTLYVMDYFANFAKEHNSEFWHYLQTYSALSRGSSRELTYVGDLRFQVAYSLAYGVRGFSCFTYQKMSQFGSGMTDEAGNPADNYYYVQQAFKELKEWEHVYFAFDYQGTMILNGTKDGYGVQDSKTLEKPKYKLKEHKRIKKVETEYDLLIGTFKDADNNDGFLITSWTDPYYKKNNEISVSFNDTTKALIYHNGKLVTNDADNSCYLMKDGVLEYTLEAGDYLFVVPVN